MSKIVAKRAVKRICFRRQNNNTMYNSRTTITVKFAGSDAAKQDIINALQSRSLGTYGIKLLGANTTAMGIKETNIHLSVDSSKVDRALTAIRNSITKTGSGKNIRIIAGQNYHSLMGTATAKAPEITESKGAITWAQLPDSFKIPRPLAPLKVDLNNPKDINLWKIIGPFVSTDELRVNLTGALFNSKGIVATNAHQLIFIAHPKKYKGEILTRTGNKITEKYPNYEAVVPLDSTPNKVNVLKIKTYTQAVLNGQFTNSVTKMVKFIVPDAKGKPIAIAFNGEFLIECCDSLMQLGYTDCYMHTQAASKAAVFTANKKVSLSETLVLLMPLMIGSPEGNYSNSDIDFDRELKCVYDLTTDTILNTDGERSKIDLKITADNASMLGNMSKGELATIKAVVPKRSVIPIIELACVQNNQLRVTDLETEYNQKIILPDGLYRLTNYGLLPENGDVDEFPLSLKRKDFSPALVITDKTIADKVKIASEFASRDELRVQFTGAYFEVTDKVTTITASDGNVLMHDVIQAQAKEKNVSWIQPALKQLYSFLKNNADEIIVVKNALENNKVQYVAYEITNASLITRSIDEKYPNYPQVFPVEYTRLIKINIASLNNLLKKYEPKNYDAITILPEQNKYAVYQVKGLKEYETTPPKLLGYLDVEVKQKTTDGGTQNGYLFMPYQGKDEALITVAVHVIKRVISAADSTELNIWATESNNRGLFVFAEGKSKKQKTVKNTDTSLELEAEALALELELLSVALGGLFGSDSVVFDWHNYGDIEKNYGEVYGRFTQEMIKAHKYFAAETDEFTNFDNVKGEILAAWQQHISKVNRISSEATKPGITPYSHAQHYSEGKRYKDTQNLSTKEITELVRDEIKILFPKPEYNISVTYDSFSGGSSIDVRVKAIPFNPFSEIYQNAYQNNIKVNDMQQEYWKENNGRYPDHYNEKAKKFIDKLNNIVEQYNFDNSDGQIDYFHVNYYSHVNIEENALVEQYYPNNVEALESKERSQKWEARTKERNAKAKEAREAAGNYKKGEVVFYNPVKLHQSWEKYKLPNGKYLAMISKGVSGRARFGGNYEVQILQDISNQPDELKKYDEYKATGTKYNLGYYATFEGKTYKRILQNLSAWPNVLSRTTNTEPDNTALELEAEALALELELLKLK